MHMQLKEKYVLHIPLAKYTNNELKPLDIDDTVSELINQINENGLYMQKVKSYYKSRIYDELIITVFTKQNNIGEIFKEWFIKNNHILKQEAMAYEYNGILLIEEL